MRAASLAVIIDDLLDMSRIIGGTMNLTPQPVDLMALTQAALDAVRPMAEAKHVDLRMCHNVHMKTISIRELHLKTGRWVRHAARGWPIVVTDRGRRVAALQPFDASVTGRPLPNREAAIRKRSKVPVDSAVYQSELREGR